MTPKITIITATYNSGATIKDCLDSISNQDYACIEHIIIDGGSTDDTVSIITDYSKKYTHITWISEPDAGIYDALNKGLKMASGVIIGFLHSDDLFANHTIISRIVASFTKDSIDGVYGDLVYVKKDNISHIVRNWRSKAFKPPMLRQGWMPAHPTLFLKRDVYHVSGFFNLSYTISSDYDFVLRVFSNRDLCFTYLDTNITIMRLGGASNKTIRNIIVKMREDLRAIKSNKIKYPAYVLFVKNVSKFSQFFKK
tara:strand:+ start:29597 stop:30358 length:762 start_codon:yes stop_codon:yes gene_type:complete